MSQTSPGKESSKSPSSVCAKRALRKAKLSLNKRTSKQSNNGKATMLKNLNKIFHEDVSLNQTADFSVKSCASGNNLAKSCLTRTVGGKGKLQMGITTTKLVYSEKETNQAIPINTSCGTDLSIRIPANKSESLTEQTDNQNLKRCNICNECFPQTNIANHISQCLRRKYERKKKEIEGTTVNVGKKETNIL